MREVHLRSPIWMGDRSQVYIGIARHRVLDRNGNPAKGNIRIWIDYKEVDSSNPQGWKLVYPYPFTIKCSQVVEYKRQILNDYNHTVLHIVPLSAMREVKNYRSGSKRGRTMTQDDWNSLIAASNAVKEMQQNKET